MTIPEYKHLNIQRLVALLQKPRGGGTSSTRRFMRWWFSQWTTLVPTDDEWGNWHLDIPMTDGTPSRTLFCAHTDTVDSTSRGLKNLGYISDKHILCLHGAQPKGISCLGADDGAGVEALVSMAEAGIPGYYLWTADEETGAHGIDGLLLAGAMDFSRFQRAIEIDRAGTSDVITWQMGGECCSDEFALELSIRLGGTFEPSYHGVFTDTARLTHLIPECTNISCGYDDQHQYRETLDIQFLSDLVGKLKTISYESLPVVRVASPRYAKWSDRVRGSFSVSDIVEDDPGYVVRFLRDRNLTYELEYQYNEESKAQRHQKKSYSTNDERWGFTDAEFYGY